MYVCPICDHPMRNEPKDHAICGWCGVQFSYDDDGITHEDIRKLYEAAGRPEWRLSPNPNLDWLHKGIINVQTD